MDVKVGNQLRWLGHPVICTSICHSEETRIATMNSELVKLSMQALGNVKYLDFQVESFSEGDVIKVTIQRVEFTELGRNLWHLYTVYLVRKDDEDESTGAKGSDRQAAAEQAESPEREGQSGEGVGQQSTGEDGDTRDGDGSSGEGGPLGHPEGGEGAEYSYGHDGSGVVGRAQFAV